MSVVSSKLTSSGIHRKISIIDLLVSFLVGGIVVVGTTLIANKFSSKWAALFWCFPLTLLTVIIFLYYQKVNKTYIRDFVGNVIPALFVLFGYIIIFWIALKNNNFWKAFIISLFGFVILAIIFLIVMKRYHKL